MPAKLIAPASLNGDAVSAVEQVQEQHTVLPGKLHDSHTIIVGRLNIMDARMGHLKKHAGFAAV